MSIIALLAGIVTDSENGVCLCVSYVCVKEWGIWHICIASLCVCVHVCEYTVCVYIALYVYVHTSCVLYAQYVYMCV